jgi:hypothetical protein
MSCLNTCYVQVVESYPWNATYELRNVAHGMKHTHRRELFMGCNKITEERNIQIKESCTRNETD